MRLIAKDCLDHPHHVRRVGTDERIRRYVGYDLVCLCSRHRSRDVLGLGRVLGRYLRQSLNHLLGVHVLLRCL